MSELSAYSDCLDLPAAKKLLVAMQKPGKQGAWANWSGEGGSETEEKMQAVSIPDLRNWRLPEFCTSYFMELPEEVYPCSYLPDEPWIGGDAFKLPEFGDCVTAGFSVVLRDLNYPISFGISKISGMKHHARTYNECCTIVLSFPKMEYQMERLSYGKFPNKHLASEVVNELKGKFQLPDENSPALLEKRTLVDAELGEFSLSFELSRFGTLKTCFKSLLEHVLADSPCQVYRFKSLVNFGSAAKFEGEVHNVSPVIRELLPLVAEVNDFPAYDLTYYPLGARSWKDREKTRKKLKTPSPEQLGTATLENGTEAKVSLGIEKEGYVFYLTFESDDDLIKFYHSKLFRKTRWHSGAE